MSNYGPEFDPSIQRLFESLTPYDGTQVCDEVLWPLINCWAGHDWRKQQPDALPHIEQLPVRNKVDDAVLDVSLSAARQVAELVDNTDEYDNTGIQRPADECQLFASGSIVIAEVLEGSAIQSGVEAFERIYPGVAKQLRIGELIVKDTTEFSFDQDNDLKLFRYRSVESRERPDNHWIVAGDDPRTLIVPSDNYPKDQSRLSDADMHRLESGLTVLRAPEAIMKRHNTITKS